MPAARLEAADAARLLGALRLERHAVIALSGGADSTALAWLAAKLASGCRFTCVIIDHGLRAGSAAEAQAARTVAEALGHGAIIRRWEGGKPSSGIQAAAREARYRLLVEAARECGAGAILTAHTLDDVAETFLMRLARGSGADGLAAIAPESDLQGIRLLRPLLEVGHAQLTATLAAENISWSEDPSNRAEEFERARLRQAMAQGLPGLSLSPEKIALSARRLARARAALEAETARVAARAIKTEAEETRLDLSQLSDVVEEIRIRLLSRLLPGAELAQIEAVAEWAFSGPGQVRTLAGLELRRVADCLILRPEKPRTG